MTKERHIKTVCNFCSKPVNDDMANELKMIIVGNVIKLDYDAYSCDSSFSEQIEINYCPMCGRDLLIKC